MLDDSGLLSLTKTAQLLKTTQVNILMHVRRGLLEQVEVDGLWYITIASLEGFVSENGVRKSDRVCASGCARHAACSGSCA